MDKITMPVLMVDEDKCQRNIRNMVQKAENAGVDFRPHFKTHQSLTIGRWFREKGVYKIAVSSFSMATRFAKDGWKDIMVAFPVNLREMSALNQLAGEIKLGILLSDPGVLPTLKTGLMHKTDFYIKLDVGNHRSGFIPDDLDGIKSLLDQAKNNPLLKFRGFVAHAGHTYQTRSLNEVHKIFREGSGRLEYVKNTFAAEYPDAIVSWGDTPTCSLMDEFETLDEIRPGNFVFYDLMQYHLASCDWDQIAMVLAAPVVSRQNARKEVVVYSGAVHLSKDYLELDGPVFGEVVRLTEKQWERFPEPVYVNRLSQEHGILKCPDEYFDTIMPGDLLGIIPVHSCLTADAVQKYYNLKTGEFFQ